MQVTGKQRRKPDDMPKWTWLAYALFVGVSSAWGLVRAVGEAVVYFVTPSRKPAPRRRPDRD